MRSKRATVLAAAITVLALLGLGNVTGASMAASATSQHAVIAAGGSQPLDECEADSGSACWG
jgi:hypothetical protein